MAKKKVASVLRLVRFASTTGNGESEQQWRRVETASLEIASAKGDVSIHLAAGKVVVEQRASKVEARDRDPLTYIDLYPKPSQRMEFDV